MTPAGAVGAAAAGAAGAVGAAATGAAAVAGSAIAGTAVGGAVTGAMGAVGTGIGAAAAAASAAPVIGGAAGTLAAMTGTAAGATAVGTVATTGAIGIANGISGTMKLSEASDIKDAAMHQYDTAKTEFDKIQGDTHFALESLGKEKIKIWSSFNRFVTMYSKIQNPPVMAGEVKKDSLELSVEDLNNIRAVAVSVKDLISGGIGSIAVGNLIGLATSGGVVSAITVASTGTAISALSGAAATNATLAALGGGSLATGGAGMAGGAAVLGGLTVAPMLMVGGIMLNSKAGKALESANDIGREVDGAVTQMVDAEVQLKKVTELSNQILRELGLLNESYMGLMNTMEQIVGYHTNYPDFSYEEKKKLEKTILALKLLKVLSMQSLLGGENDNTVLEAEVNQAVVYSAKNRKEQLAV